MNVQDPLISCLCISKGNPSFLKTIIDCFISQTYPRKELIIIYEGSNDFLETLDHPEHNIKTYQVALAPKKTLGDLRNMAVSNAEGEYVCQWDDDDWYHKDRLLNQYNYSKTDNCAGSILNRWLVYDKSEKVAYLSNERLWEGSILCQKEPMLQSKYESLSIGEDTSVIEYLDSNKLLQHMPSSAHLYIYTYHGKNTWDHQHWSRIFDYSTRLSETQSEIVEKILNGQLNCSEGSLILDDLFSDVYTLIL